MTTAIDYKMEKKGYVLLEEGTSYFFQYGTGRGWYKITQDLRAAYFFPSKAKAVACAKEPPLRGRKWLVIPASVVETVDATRAVRVFKRKPDGEVR